MNKSYFLIIAMMLSGCGPFFANYTPTQLPDACLNQPYKQYIELQKGGASAFYAEISNPDFKFIPAEKRFRHMDEHNQAVYLEDYTGTTLTGIPTSLEPIKIKIQFSLYRSMAIYSRKNFSQKYTIKVKECQQ